MANELVNRPLVTALAAPQPIWEIPLKGQAPAREAVTAGGEPWAGLYIKLIRAEQVATPSGLQTQAHSGDRGRPGQGRSGSPPRERGRGWGWGRSQTFWWVGCPWAPRPAWVMLSETMVPGAGEADHTPPPAAAPLQGGGPGQNLELTPCRLPGGVNPDIGIRSRATPEGAGTRVLHLCLCVCVHVCMGGWTPGVPAHQGRGSARALALLGPQDWWWQRGQEVPAVLLKRAAAQAPGQAYCQKHILHCDIL